VNDRGHLPSEFAVGMYQEASMGRVVLFFLFCLVSYGVMRETGPAPETQRSEISAHQQETIAPVQLTPVRTEAVIQPIKQITPATNIPTKKVMYPGPALDPAWKKEIYVVTDSVVLGAKAAIQKNFKAIGWKSTVDGRPAMMIKAGINEYVKKKTTLPEVAVVALGYNSLWEKDRKNFDRWAKKFDAEVELMLKNLSSRGVKKVVWVLLREANEDLVPSKNKTAKMQYQKYAWYFPYANERLKALQEKHPEMALADWPSVSQSTDLTYDLIHLNPKGAKTMTDEIMLAIGVEPPTEEMLKAKKKAVASSQ
jgi:lysophospholipase L1-like esterase